MIDKRVKDVFPLHPMTWPLVEHTDGLFYHLFTDLNIDDLPASDGSNLDYIFPRLYGERKISPTGYMYTGEAVTEATAQVIAAHVALMYGERWLHLWSVYKAEYNPINNYDMSETEETEAATGGTVEGSSSDSITRSRTESGSVYGFNSAVASPSESGTGSDSETRTGSDSQESTGTASGSRTLTRSGNIGVTTSQQMIQSEIDLWKWSFYKEVMEDVLRFISIPIY